jgi:hypothetical protein
MSIDLTKLTPAPWAARTTDCGWVAGPNGHPVLVAENDDDQGQASVTFAALARNAFDVMIRRGWNPVQIVNGERSGQWKVVGEMSAHTGKLILWAEKFAFTDPFTALVEADRWYAANVEAK